MILEALAAVHRLARARVEGNLGLLAAFAAGSRVECALATTATAEATLATIAIATAVAIVAAVTAAVAVTTGVVALRLACLAAARAALRFRESARRVKILLTCREHELVAAIAAGKRSIAHFRLNLSCPHFLCASSCVEKKTPPGPHPDPDCTQTHVDETSTWFESYLWETSRLPKYSRKECETVQVFQRNSYSSQKSIDYISIWSPSCWN